MAKINSKNKSPLKAAQATFKNPPTDYRPMPFTVLNDEYEPGRGEKQLTRFLEGLKRAGYGGAYLHPRQGLMTEYLSPRWFEVIRHCVKECKRLGLKPHLYDENSYPSGFAGGHVPARVPEARCRYVAPLRGRGPTDPEAAISLRRWENGQPGPALKRTEIKDDTEWVAFALTDFASMPWHGETIYSSLLDPRTGETFLETTYEAYRRELGNLWKDVDSIFTDEPHLPGSTHGPWSAGLHLTAYVLGQFRQRLGYDLAEKLAELFYNVGDYRKTRYDFYNLCHTLWMENWAQPLEKWCHKNGIKLTGHYLEHDWPCPYATPGHVHLLAHMDWPGTDMLEGFLLRGHDFYDVQGFDPAPAGAEPHALLYLRQVHSIANQLGKERVMDESWGASGGESAPEDWMRIGRWLIVHGVNHLVPHSAWDTIRGARKTDHPPNFGPQSGWFEYLQPLNDELARLCWAGNQGECHHRVLVVDSLTSGFCAARKVDCSDPESLAVFRNLSFDSDLRSTVKSLSPIKEQADRFAQMLSDAQVDFDLGDEYVLEEFGGAGKDGLSVGRRTYPLVVLVPGMEHLRSATVKRLREHLKKGGHLLSLPLGPFYVDGAESSELAKLQKEFPSSFEQVGTVEKLAHRIEELQPPRISFSGEVPKTGVAHLRRMTGYGELFLIVNSAPETLLGEAHLQTKYQNITLLTPGTGEAHRLGAAPESGGLRVPVEIPGGGAIVLLASNEAGTEPEFAPEKNGARKKLAAVELLRAERCEDNIFALDLCTVEIGGKEFPQETVAAANGRYWKAHGMETNGWNLVIQYRDQIMARDKTMHPESGGCVHYRFEIAPGTKLDQMRLVVECPEVWQVAVNGAPVKFNLKNVFRDPRFHWASTAGKLRHGKNEVTLTARPFSVRQEIDQIYLLGDFSCETASVGFRIGPPRPIGWGSWRKEGLPFYDAGVAYFVRLPEGATEIVFDRKKWGGALIEVRQNGRELGRVTEAPWKLKLPSLTSRELELRVIGLPRNLYGPWHTVDGRWGVAGPWSWIGAQAITRPRPGAEYSQVDVGFFQAPVTG